MATTHVNAGDDLQAAIDAAQPGDTLELEMAATWSQDFLLPPKADGAPVTVTAPADKLPAKGNRITEEQSMGMPRLVGHIKTNARSSNYVLRGIRMEAYPDYYTGGLIELSGSGINGDKVITNEADLPRNWTLEHMFLQANPTMGGKRGVAANCAGFVIEDSVVQGFWSDFQDTQAVGAWNSPGPFRIVNNKLEASGENIMFGGACPSIPQLTPTDILIEHNWLYKPQSWRAQRTSLKVLTRGGGRKLHRSTKSTPAVKNLFEIKNGQKVKVQKNILEGCWSSAQAGFALQLTVRTCEAGDYPWACVNDVLIQDNLIISENGINILGMDGNRSSCGEPSYAGEAVTIHILRNRIQANWVFQILSGARNIRIEQNTCETNTGAAFAFDTVPEVPEMTDLAVNGNLIAFGSGILGTSAGPGTQALDAFWSTWQMTGNCFPNVPPSEMWWINDGTGYWYPAGNLYLESGAEIPYSEYGCDEAALEATLKHVRDGQTASTPNPEPNPAATLYVDVSLPSGEYMVVPV